MINKAIVDCNAGPKATPIVIPMTQQEEAQAVAESNEQEARIIAAQRLKDIDAVIAGDATLAQLKAMTSAEFDTWWSANVTNASQAIAVLKRLARLVIRRLL